MRRSTAPPPGAIKYAGRVRGMARRYYYVNEFTQKRTTKQLTCA